MTARMLGGLALPASICHKGADAQHMFDTLAPDMVMLSVELSDQNGFMTYKKLRERPGGEDVKIIMTSSEKTEKDFDRHRKLKSHRPADAYLAKPVDPQVVLQTVVDLLDLTTASGDFQQAIKDFGEEVDVTYDDLEDAESPSHAAAGDVANLREELEEKNRQLDYLKKEMDAVKNHLPMFQRNEQALTKTKTSLEEAQRENQDLKEALEKAQSEQKNRDQLLQEALTKQAELEEALEVAQSQQAKSQQSQQALSAQQDNAKHTIDRLQGELDEVREVLKTTRGNLREREQELEESHNTRMRALNDLEAMREGLDKREKDIHIKEAQAEEALDARRKAEQTLVSLETEIKELKRRNQELHGIQSAGQEELDQLRRSDHEYKEEQGRLKSEIENLSRELNQAEVRGKEQRIEYEKQADNMQARIDELNADITRFREEADKTQRSLTKERDDYRDRLQSEAGTLQSQVDEWKAKHREENNHRTRLETLLKETEERLEKRSGELERSLENTKENADQDLVKARKQHETDLANARRSLQSQIDDLQRQNDDWQRRFKEQSETLNRLRNQQRDDIEQRHQRITRLEQDLAAAEKARHSGHSREREAERFAEDIRKRLNTLTGRQVQTDTAASDRAESGTVLEQALRESRQRVEELEDLSGELAKLKENNRGIEQDVQRLRLSNETLRGRLERAVQLMENGLRELQGDTEEFDFDED